MLCLVGGWGGECAAAPTGKSFRFVRACERAGARAAPNQLPLPRGICEMNVSPSSSSPRGLRFYFFDPPNAKNIRKHLVVVVFEHFST